MAEEFEEFLAAIGLFSATVLNAGHDAALEHLATLPDEFFRGPYNVITAAAYYVNRPWATCAIPYLKTRGATHPGRIDTPYVGLPHQILHFYSPETVTGWVRRPASVRRVHPDLDAAALFKCLMYIFEDIEDPTFGVDPRVREFVRPHYDWVKPPAEELARKIDVDTSLSVGTYCGEFSRPLHMAVRGRSLPVAKLLLERGANPYLIDNEGRLPLHYAEDAPPFQRLLSDAMACREDPHRNQRPLPWEELRAKLGAVTERKMQYIEVVRDDFGNVLEIESDAESISINANAGYVRCVDKETNTVVEEFIQGHRVRPDDRVTIKSATPLPWKEYLDTLIQGLADWLDRHDRELHGAEYYEAAVEAAMEKSAAIAKHDNVILFPFGRGRRNPRKP